MKEIGTEFLEGFLVSYHEKIFKGVSQQPVIYFGLKLLKVMQPSYTQATCEVHKSKRTRGFKKISFKIVCTNKKTFPRMSCIIFTES